MVRLSPQNCPKVQGAVEIEASLCPQFVPNKKNLTMYQLQCWCDKFNCFAYVSNISELSDSNRLTIERVMCSREQLSAKRSLISEATRKLGRLLKGSSGSGPSSSRKRSLTFDPSAECVALPQLSKKKKVTRNRTCRMY